MLRDLRAAGVDTVTLGQYLRPTRRHEPVHRYLQPGGFPRISSATARGLGFAEVYAGVFVRSSFNAEEVYRGGEGALSGARREGLAALSGVLLFLSFPKFGHGAVAWVALAPLLVALAGASGWRALRLGYVTGAVSSLGLLYWTALVVVQYGGLSLPVGALVMVALCLAFSVFHALFGWAAARFVSASGRRGCSARPSPGSALEYARAHTFFSFPWCLLGYSQHAQLPFIQIAAVTAVYGVSFLLSAVVFAPGDRGDRAGGRPGAGRRSRAWPLLVAGGWAYGSWQMERPAARDRPHHRGPGAGRASGRRTSGCRRTPGRTSGATCELTRAGRGARGTARGLARVGGAVPVRRGARAGGAAARASCRGAGSTCSSATTTASGGPRRQGRIYVGAKLLEPGGALLARYRKMHLVPFGEYVPLQRAVHARRPLRREAGAGGLRLQRRDGRPSPATVDGHAIGGYICYEAIFPELVRRFAGRGRRAARQHHERRLVRHHLGALPAPGDGRLPGGREPALHGARGEHGHHGGRRPAGACAGEHAPVRHDRARARGALRRRDHLLRPPRRRCSPRPAWRPRWRCSWPRRGRVVA